MLAAVNSLSHPKSLLLNLPLSISNLLRNAIKLSADHSTIKCNGWIRGIRQQKSVTFILVNDGSISGDFQIVTSTSLVSKLLLTPGTCISALGNLVPCKSNKPQNHELSATEIQVLQECKETVDGETQDYPLSADLYGFHALQALERLRKPGAMPWRWRSRPLLAMMQVRHALTNSVHQVMQELDCIHVHTPILTQSNCEGGCDAFAVHHVHQKDPSFLTVSAQLHLEAMTASAMSRVYTLSPAFRAEPSRTTRHLSEFWMMETEWAFIHSVDGLCNLIEHVVQSIVRDSLLKLNDALDILIPNNEKLEKLQHPFGRMSYSDAIRLLNANGFTMEWGQDLQTDHERFLCEEIEQRPVFITDYPLQLKPFYVLPNSDGKTGACCDLLVPHVGELVGGSVRDWDPDRVAQRLGHERVHDYKWYIDLRRQGGAPHAGFGLGFERLVMALTGLSNIRDCIGMPRTVSSVIL